jgi:hypothetical protein
MPLLVSTWPVAHSIFFYSKVLIYSPGTGKSIQYLHSNPNFMTMDLTDILIKN